MIQKAPLSPLTAVASHGCGVARGGELSKAEAPTPAAPPVAAGTLSSYRCTSCGQPALFVRPGQDAIRVSVPQLLLRPNRQDRCWCLSCWLKRFGGG